MESFIGVEDNIDKWKTYFDDLHNVKFIVPRSNWISYFKEEIIKVDLKIPPIILEVNIKIPGNSLKTKW